MADEKDLLRNLSKLDKFISKLKEDLPRIVGMESKKFVQSNFDKEGFQGTTLEVWKKRVRESSRSEGKKILADRGNLKAAIKYEVQGDSVSVGLDGNKFPHAQLHNEGGEMTPTAKQKSYFWAMYYNAKKISDADSDKKEKSAKDLRLKNSIRAIQGKKALKGKALKTSKKVNFANKDMEFWLAMALAKKLTFTKRQFIGESPVIWTAVEKVFEDRCLKIQKDLNL